jgi:3-oxoacyl-[acyl-carrier-protein] synthase-3
VGYLLPPQLSGRMAERLVNFLALPDVTEISCVADTGNTGNALLFGQLDRLELGVGERAVAITVEPGKWIKGGFAVEGVAG